MNVSDSEFLNAICRENFDAFAARAFREVYPGVPYEWNWHIGCLCAHLQALYEGTLPEGKKRLCINVPPKTLKSFLASIAFPAWVMGRESYRKFICTSFNFSLSKEMAQKSRILVESDWYKRLFPKTRIDPRQNEKHNFWTTDRGFYYSSAVQSVTGKGGDYLTLDDPINPHEAMSDTVRTATNDTIHSTLPTRFADLREAKWLLIMQRIHEDDPTGHFAISDDRWYVLKMPGENLTGKDIVYELNGKRWVFKAGDLLFQARLTREVLDSLREDLGEYNYAGQILQSPVPIGGGEIKPEWFQMYAPGAIKPREMNIYILVDPAGGEDLNKKKKKMSDWTAMFVIGLANDNNFYVLDIIRDRLNPTERINTLFMLHRKWNSLAGKSPKVGWEKYGLQSDTHYITEKKKTDAYNFPLIELGGSMSKEERIRRIIPDAQNGRWYFPYNLMYVDTDGRKFDLVQEVLTGEVPTFPRARYDDCLDCMTRIYDAELDKVFPKVKMGMVAKAIKQSYNEPTDSWENF